MRHVRCAGLAIMMALAGGQACAQEKLKIGVIVTLSGPAAALGQQVRDGFGLAIRDLGRVLERDAGAARRRPRDGDLVRLRRDVVQLAAGVELDCEPDGGARSRPRRYVPR